MSIFSLDDLDFGSPPPRECRTCRRREPEAVFDVYSDHICTICMPGVMDIGRQAHAAGMKAGRIEAGATPKMSPRELAMAEFRRQHVYKRGDIISFIFQNSQGQRLSHRYMVVDVNKETGELTLGSVS